MKIIKVLVCLTGFVVVATTLVVVSLVGCDSRPLPSPEIRAKLRNITTSLDEARVVAQGAENDYIHSPIMAAVKLVDLEARLKNCIDTCQKVREQIQAEEEKEGK